MASGRTLALALLMAASACARVAVPGAEAPAGVVEPTTLVTRTEFSGVTTFGGRRLRVLVQLLTDAQGQGTGHLELPDLPLSADGSAAFRGETLELDLRYDGACPGDLRIRARRMADGPRLVGTLTAKDCTGEESGTVVLEAAPSPSIGTGGSPRVESVGRGA